MINTATIMGRLTAAPELKVTESGTSVLRFCVAVERAYTPKGQERQTDFINIVAWRQIAEFIDRNFGKGQMIAVTGEINTRKYQDSQGISRTAFEIVAREVSFCGDKKTAPAAPEPESEDPLDVEYDDPYLEY